MLCSLKGTKFDDNMQERIASENVQTQMLQIPLAVIVFILKSNERKEQKNDKIT